MNIKYFVISDIHLGHNINKTDNIVNNLNNYFEIYSKEFKDLDMIIIAGDVFDKLLVNSGSDYITAVKWIIDLMLYCKRNNIILRILEGTPSHDWKQMKSITSIIEKLNLELDYKYVDTLHIEYIDKYKIHILYIPDEYKNKAVDTYQDVLKLMKKNKLTQVDIAIMHGAFNFQLPFQLESSHNEQDYLSIVKHYIHVGHVHTSKIYQRILAQGSFDRLAHNEEENKGGMLINVDTENIKNDNYKFLTNNNAMVFKTIRFKQESIDEIIKSLDNTIKKLPNRSNIRIMSEHEDFLSKSIEDIKKRYPTLNIKYERNKTKIKKKSIIDETIVIDSFNITKDNIVELLKERVEKYNFNKQELDIFQNEIKKAIGVS